MAYHGIPFGAVWDDVRGWHNHSTGDPLPAPYCWRCNRNHFQTTGGCPNMGDVIPAPEPTSTPAAALKATRGAIDVYTCPNRRKRSLDCFCLPKCAACGFGPHMAVHGPAYDQPPNTTPFDHEYQPT